MFIESGNHERKAILVVKRVKIIKRGCGARINEVWQS